MKVNKKKALIAIIIITCVLIVFVLTVNYGKQSQYNQSENRLSNVNKSNENSNYILDSLPSSQSSTNIVPRNEDDTNSESTNNQNSNENATNQIQTNDNNTSNESLEYSSEDRLRTSQDVENAVRNAAPLTGPDYMNRDQMKEVTSEFVTYYYNTSNWLVRKQKLGSIIDQDYISNHKNELLYQDYFVHDAGENSLVHSYTQLQSIDDITIVNAKKTSPIVEVKYTFTDYQYADSGSGIKSTTPSAQEITRTVSYKIQLSESYKVRDFKFVRNYY